MENFIHTYFQGLFGLAISLDGTEDATHAFITALNASCNILPLPMRKEMTKYTTTIDLFSRKRNISVEEATDMLHQMYAWMSGNTASPIDPNVKFSLQGDITAWSYPLWDLIHLFAIAVDEQKGKPYWSKYFDNYMAFMRALKFLIPCGSCREHYRENLVQLPTSVHPTLFAWSFQLHRLVNTKTGKETQAMEFYYQQYKAKNVY